MRLSSEQRRVIREEVAAVFGPDTPVLLFGSRADDRLRGGDIDLHVRNGGDPAQRLDQELQLHVRLQRRLGERRIDIVVQGPGEPRPIDRRAQRTGVPL